MLRSPRPERTLDVILGMVIGVSNRSPALLAFEDIEMVDSPQIDLRSSSPLDGGEMGNMTRDSRLVDKSSGESANNKDTGEECLSISSSIQI
jgi:hypothetical protein